MPVEPEWLLEAVGLVRLDTSQPIEGPTPVGSGRLQIRSRQPSLMGPLEKVTVVDAWDGTVLEQHLYDPRQQLLATARTSRYKRDPISGAALPRSIELQWPTMALSLRLEIVDWQVNTIAPDNMTLWTKPVYQGYPETDLANPNVQFVPPGNAPAPPASAVNLGQYQPHVVY